MRRLYYIFQGAMLISIYIAIRDKWYVINKLTRDGQQRYYQQQHECCAWFNQNVKTTNLKDRENNKDSGIHTQACGVSIATNIEGFKPAMGFQQGSNDINKQSKPSIDFIHQTFEDNKGVIRR